MISIAVAIATTAVTVLPPTASARSLDRELAALQESSLESWPVDRPMFRFIWLPPFTSQRVICVRVEQAAGGPVLTAKTVYLKGGPPESTSRAMSAAEWQALADSREKGFWKYRPQPYPQPVFDGSVWVLEGAVAEERLRLLQHVPDDGPFVDLCRRMFMMSGIRLLAPEWETDLRKR